MVHKTGGTLYGNDARKWPAWWADTVEVLTAERMYANAVEGVKD